MTAGRPIGNHIRTICAVLVRIGPAGYKEIHSHTDGIKPITVGQCCTRAVKLGMMTVKLGSRTAKDFNVYTVVQDWEDIAGQRRTTKLRPTVKIQVLRWTGVNSVFAMHGA